MKSQNLATKLAIISKGFIAMVMQILVIREILIIFSGNELSLGIVLGVWLLLEALGSSLIAGFFAKIRDNLKAYVILQILIILSLPLTIWLARTAKANLGIFYGEVLNLPQMFLILLITLLTFSLFDGLQFFFACRMLSGKNFASNITKAYILEALGMLLGGVIFTYVFLPLFNSFQITTFLSCIAILITLYLCLVTNLKKKRIIIGFLISLLFLSLFLTLTGKINALQKISLQRQFPNQKILDYQNSNLGNVTVTESKNQITLFYNGVASIVLPVTDIAFVEEFVHLSLLYHPEPSELLLISNGTGGIINEILKEPVTQVTFAELDPLIIREVKKFPTSLTNKELSDKRVSIIYRDGRSAVKNSGEKFDAILLNVSSPVTLQVNRLFTQEFYQETKKILNTGGIISLRLPGSLTYLNDELKLLNASILKTLSSVYRFVIVIPGDFNLFLASDTLDLEKVLSRSIIARFKERGLKTSLLTESSLNYRLDKAWKDWFSEQIRDAKNDSFLNKDFSPRGLFYGLAFLYSLISPKTKNLFMAISRINLAFIIVVLFSIFLIFALASRKNKNILNFNISWIIFISGLSGITFELTLILGFQIIYGFIYSWVGILSGAFMFGLACGGFIISKKLSQVKNNFVDFLKIEFSIIIFALTIPALLILLSKVDQQLLLGLGKLIFFALSFTAGLLLGGEFSLANEIYFSCQKADAKTSRLYAFDLMGACVGAVVSSVVLIPVLGIWETILLIASLKLLGVTAFFFSVRK